MTYKPVQTGDFPLVWDFEQHAEVEFVLKSKKEDVGKYRQMLYTIEELTTREVFDVWGCAILDRQMEKMKEGEQGKLTFKGIKHNDRWNKDMQDFVLEIWSAE